MTDLVVPAGVPMLSETDARILTLSIRRGIDELDTALRAAVVGRIHLAMGYDTLTDWWVNEVGSARLSGEVRDMWIRQIKADRPDMGVRGIAAALGVSRETVRRELAPDTNVSPRDSNESRPPFPGPADPGTNDRAVDEATPASTTPPNDPRAGGESPAGFAVGGAGETPAPAVDHSTTAPAASLREPGPAVASPREDGAATAAPALRLVPTEDEKRAAEQRDARALLRRVVEILAPVHDPGGFVETWARQLGPYDDELSDLIHRANNALAALDDLISEAGK